jgi:hypothetical protein
MVTTWTRIEPHAQTTDLDAGLAAEVADPLWFLARQLQLGELTGEDGGSPVAVDVRASWTRFTHYRAEGPAPGRARRLHHRDGPLEAVVEGEALLRLDRAAATGNDAWAARVRAGRSLDRALRQAQLARVANRLATDDATSFRPAGEGPPSGAAEARYRSLLTGRCIDAVRVLRRLRSRSAWPEAVLAGLGTAARARMQAVIETWAEATEAEWGVRPAGSAASPAWLPDRLEYRFSLAAPPLPELPGDDPKEVVLQAAEYDGTGLEWFSLDLVPGELGAGQGDGDADDEPATGWRITTLLPAPLTFPGMAADRFWEMEDAAVALGDLDAGPTDLARMLAVDFAVLYSTDWYVAPVEVPVGCVARMDWVVVRDTFGEATLVGTSATQHGDGVGRQFQPSQADGSDGDHPLLVVLPASMATLRSTPREDVTFQRDEVANLAWAIERTVLGPAGRGVEQPWFRSQFPLPPARTDEDHELVWRLATPVAATWTPFVADVSPDGTRWLVQARTLDTATGDVRSSKSRILAELHPVDGDRHRLGVREEEITRAGSRVTTLEQLARWHDGSTFVWRGREKRPGRGEVSSQLRFDAALPDAGT